MAAVEGAHPQREREVVRRLAGFEQEVLDGDLPDVEPPGRDLRGSVTSALVDGGRGAVGGQDEAVGSEASDDLAGGRSGTAPDLEHPHPWLEWERLDRGQDAG